MSSPLGTPVSFCDLSADEQAVVLLAWKGANSSADNGLCMRSDFPVGSGILAENDDGEQKKFCGCNVENHFFPATICAERNAGTTAVFEGYNRFRIVAVLCRKYPGGSPCGLCRQVLVQFGQGGVLLNVVDRDSNVRKALIKELLPAAKNDPVALSDLPVADRRRVHRLMRLKTKAYVPYSKQPSSALFVAYNDKGTVGTFPGASEDNASYGGSARAETVSMRSARTAGYTQNVQLFVTVDNPTAPNPLDGESLQVLREFGADAPICLVGDNQVVFTSLDELLPDSFGPEAL